MAGIAGARREAAPCPGAQLPGTAPRGPAAAPPPRSGTMSSTPARHRFAHSPCLWVWGLSPRARRGGSEAEGTGMEELPGGRRCWGKTPRARALRGLAIRARAQRRLRRCNSLRRSTSPGGVRGQGRRGWPRDLPSPGDAGSLRAHRRDPHRVLHRTAPSQPPPVPGGARAGTPMGTRHHGFTQSQHQQFTFR